MKTINKIICAICVICGFMACQDDDYKNIVQQGDPQIGVNAIQTAQMGRELQFNVNCTDRKGEALSTLKAELLFSGETVDETTIRTKEAGDYQVSLSVPYLQYIPNGEATVRLTLQNVTTSKTVVEVQTQVERPHFQDLQFITSDSTVYLMTETADYNYAVSIQTAQTAFKGRFVTKDGEWAFGSNGAEVVLGGTGNIDFQTETSGEVEVTFNTRDYTYGPLEEIGIAPLLFTESDNVITRDMVQGRQYTIEGIVGEGWYVDPDFFELNDDDTYTFLAVDGTYTITAYSAYEFVQVYAGTASDPATMQADGSGALWVIGGSGINKPYLTSANNNGWWTGTEWDQATAQVSSKVYQITLTVGRQLSATDINFKFFGQPNWGTEFKGDGQTDYNLTCDSEIFGVGDGNGHDNGNIYLKEGATLTEGDTYIFTVDLTAGTANGRLIVKKGASEGVQAVELGTDPVVVTVKKGMQFQFSGNVGDGWFVDPDFFQKNDDGTYTFLAVSGTYAIKAYADYEYVQVWPSDEAGKVRALQSDGTGSIWAIGSESINKPYLSSANNHGWWVDPDWDQCLAEISAKKFRITLTVGQQLSATDVNFKFFGQANWGVEFLGDGSGEYNLTCDSDVFGVGDGNGHDNGNLYLKDGAVLNDGDTYVFTIDLTKGVANGVLTIDKR